MGRSAPFAAICHSRKRSGYRLYGAACSASRIPQTGCFVATAAAAEDQRRSQRITVPANSVVCAAGDNCGLRRCKAEPDLTVYYHKDCGICELQSESVRRKTGCNAELRAVGTAETGEFKTQIRHYAVIPGTRSYLVSVCANDSCRNSPLRRVRHYATTDYYFGFGEQRHYDGGELRAIPPLVLRCSSGGPGRKALARMLVRPLELHTHHGTRATVLRQYPNWSRRRYPAYDRR